MTSRTVGVGTGNGVAAGFDYSDDSMITTSLTPLPTWASWIGNLASNGGRIYVAISPGSYTYKCWVSNDWGVGWNEVSFPAANTSTSAVQYFTMGHLFYFNSKFVFFGFADNFRSTAYSSDNGNTWTINTTGLPSTTAADGWTNYAISPSKVLIITSTQCYQTIDGMSWTNVSTIPSTTGTYKSIAWDGTYFVAIALEGTTYKVTKSTDGVTWDSLTAISNLPSIVGNFNTLTSNGAGSLVYYSSAVANSSYSTNHGVTWAVSSSAITNTWRVKFVDGLFWALGYAVSKVSTDGNTWTTRLISGGSVSIMDIEASPGPTVVHKPIKALSTSVSAFLKGYYLKYAMASCSTHASKSFGYFLRPLLAVSITQSISDILAPIKSQLCSSIVSSISSTIKTAQIRKLGVSSSVLYRMLARPVEGIAYCGSNAWINRSLYLDRLVSSISLPIKLFSVSTTKIANVIHGTGIKRNSKIWSNLWSITYALGKFIGVKNRTTTAATSTTGATWVAATLPASLNWSGIASDGTNVVAIAFNTNQTATSTNGTTWVSRTLPTSRNWKSITCMGTKFVATAVTSRHCAVSTDGGVNWTEYQMPQFANWLSVANNGTNFVAITDSSVTSYSADGITWTQVAMPDDIHYNSVAWAAGQFTAVATGPTMLAAKSVDGITWTGITMPSIEDWTNVGPGIGDPNA